MPLPLPTPMPAPFFPCLPAIAPGQGEPFGYQDLTNVAPPYTNLRKGAPIAVPDLL